MDFTDWGSYIGFNRKSTSLPPLAPKLTLSSFVLLSVPSLSSSLF